MWNPNLEYMTDFEDYDIYCFCCKIDCENKKDIYPKDFKFNGSTWYCNECYYLTHPDEPTEFEELQLDRLLEEK